MTDKKTPKKSGSIWNEENTKIVVAAYQAKLESDGKEAAADNDFLRELAKQVGAASEKSVRAKLNSEKVYQKPDAVASVAKTNQVRKEHYIRALVNVLGCDADDLESLKNAKVDALQSLCLNVGITDVSTASGKDYSLDTSELVKGICSVRGLDVMELAVELEEAAA